MFRVNRNRRRNAASPQNDGQTKRWRQPRLECLEFRQLLTASVQFDGGLTQLDESAISSGPQLEVTLDPATGITGTAIQRTAFVIASAPAVSASVTPAESNDYDLQSFEFPLGWGKTGTAENPNGLTVVFADIMEEGWFSVTNDQYFEGAEAVNISIVGAGGSGSTGVAGVGTQSTHQHIILDNESAMSLSIQETPIPEGNVTHNVAVTLTLKSMDGSAGNALPAVLEPAPAGGMGISGTLSHIGGTATVRVGNLPPPWDTEEIPNQLVNFPAGAGTPSGSGSQVVSTISSSISITTIDDNVMEGDETIVFGASNFPTNLTIGDFSKDTVTITDTEDVAPRVIDVEVSGSTWTALFLAAVGGVGYSIPEGAAQYSTLPWEGVDRVNILFDGPVQGTGLGGALQPSDFSLTGVLPTPAITSVSYDGGANRATLHLASPLTSNSILVQVFATKVTDAFGNELDGEFVQQQPSPISGDGVAGGDFLYRFNVLPGDYNRDGSVDILDIEPLRAGLFGTPGDSNYSAFADGNGSAGLNIVDLAAIGNNLSATLPTHSSSELLVFAAAATDEEVDEAKGRWSLFGTARSTPRSSRYVEA